MPCICSAQRTKIGLSTNALGWANYGTANLEIGVGLAQHFSVHAGARYNPWEFSSKEGLSIRNNQTSAFVGAKWWPWYVFSGWWVGGKVQYSDFARTGIWRPALEEATRIGGGVSFGYTLMVHQNLNLEFGAGVWGGANTSYNLYCCPEHKVIRKSGKGGFFGLDDISVSLMYIF